MSSSWFFIRFEWILLGPNWPSRDLISFSIVASSFERAWRGAVLVIEKKSGFLFLVGPYRFLFPGLESSSLAFLFCLKMGLGVRSERSRKRQPTRFILDRWKVLMRFGGRICFAPIFKGGRVRRHYRQLLFTRRRWPHQWKIRKKDDDVDDDDDDDDEGWGGAGRIIGFRSAATLGVVSRRLRAAAGPTNDAALAARWPPRLFFGPVSLARRPSRPRPKTLGLNQ